MMAGLGIANLWYYSSLYLLASGGISKYSPAEDSGLGVMVLALGRACYNLLLPLAISPVDYFPGAPENFLGLILLPVLIFLFWKLAASRDSVSWGIFALLPLFTVNLRSTRVFLSDTYLLLPSIGLWILIGCAWSRSKAMLWPTPIKWMTKAFALIFAVAGLWVGHLNAKSFFSLPELFSRAFSIEATPQVSLVHASQLFEEGKYREAAEIAYGLGSKVALADELYARAVSADPALAVGQKIQALKQWPSPSPVYNYYLSSLFAQAGRFRDASAVLAPYLTQLTSFGDLAPAVAADACWFLEQSGGSRENLRTLLLSQLPLAEQKVHFEKRLRELSERSRGKSP
jgi:hypothetical protein